MAGMLRMILDDGHEHEVQCPGTLKTSALQKSHSQNPGHTDKGNFKM